jgi:hypothetical protein
MNSDSNGWLGRDTAPKDGQRFIAYDPHCGLLFAMHWDGEEFQTDYERWSGHFTHWMPRPQPPGMELKTEPLASSDLLAVGKKHEIYCEGRAAFMKSECEKGYGRWIWAIIPLQRAGGKKPNYWGEYKDYEIHLSRESPKRDWYIWVYAPSGDLAYDGYWRDSAGRPIREAVAEAIRAACIDC